MEPTIARKTWRTLEPIHGMVYFIPEAHTNYTALGLHGRSGYFASRAAPMGAVAAPVVIATFFNFNPTLVTSAMDGVWETTTPALVLDARLRAADTALRRAFGDLLTDPTLPIVAQLAQRVAMRACSKLDGRPLFAGHASLDWPDAEAPHLVLWHAQSLLREFRGDGHIAALVTEGLSGIDALVLHHATGELPMAALQGSRAWPDAAWAAAVDDLATRGYVNADGSFTDIGRARRQWVEDRTDVLASDPYDAIGEDGCETLRTLGRPFSKAVVDGGLLDFSALLRANDTPSG